MDSSEEVNKAFYSRVVGKCVEILKDYAFEEDNPCLEGFQAYYLNKKGLDGLIKATGIVMAQGYSLEESIKYVFIRVFENTWVGFEWEKRAKKFIKEKYGLESRFANSYEDFKYSVDLIGSNFAIQVKPISYKIGNNPSLTKDRKKHLQNQKDFESKTGKRVGYVFYNSKTNKLSLEKYK